MGYRKTEREFLFVDDLARAVFYLINLKKNKKIFKNFPIINVGSGDEISIKNLAYKIKKVCKYKGKIIFDKKFPDGTPKKSLDSSKINRLGWKSKVKLEQGLKIVHNNYLDLKK